MNKSRCPYCGIKLGNYLCADACPHCHEELKHNTRRLAPARKQDSPMPKSWLVRGVFRIVHFVES